MDKQILRHRDFVKKEIERLKRQLDGEKQLTAWQELANYHQIQVKNLQHERHIHLLVTITFGLIMLAAWGCLFAWLVSVGGAIDIVAILLIIIVALLTILEICYLGYYYRLENRIQLLYPISKEIYCHIQAMLK